MEKEEVMVVDFRKVREILELEGISEETIQFVHNILLDSVVEKEK